MFPLRLLLYIFPQYEKICSFPDWDVELFPFQVLRMSRGADLCFVSF